MVLVSHTETFREQEVCRFNEAVGEDIDLS